MTKYKIVIEKPAEKFITKLAKPEKERVLKAIHMLPDEGDIKQLKGKRSKGLLRLRVGDYRIIYTVDNGKLIVWSMLGTEARYTTDTNPSGRLPCSYLGLIYGAPAASEGSEKEKRRERTSTALSTAL